MKIFEISFENLGPIKSAVFNAANFNVLCGKNNSGKSICMHTVFCFFRLWRKHVHLKAERSLVERLKTGERIQFEVLPWLNAVNPAIEKSIRGFVSNLPAFLKKSPGQFESCQIHIRFDEKHLLEFYKFVNVSAYCKIGPNVALRIRKGIKADQFTAWIDNMGDAEFPAVEEIESAMNKLLDYVVVERVLPMPYLLTAERSGSIMYGDGLRSKRFFESQGIGNQSEVIESTDDKRYSSVYNCELKEIWNAQAEVPSERDGQLVFNEDEIRDYFEGQVAEGKYAVEDGKFMYTDGSIGKTFEVQESSTSVRALLQINYFIKEVMTAASLLMVDEPELNLHPARQRAFIRFLAYLVNKGGVGVVLTTHSDYIIRELNTLLALGSDPDLFAPVMERYGYVKDEVVDASKVACGIVGDGTIDVKTITANSGFAIRSFDETTDRINSIQDAIATCWEKKNEDV